MRYVPLLFLFACPKPATIYAPDTDTDADTDTDTDADADADTDTDSDTDTDTDTGTNPGTCDDAAGENRDADSAVALQDGSTYSIRRDENDWFTVNVPGSSTITIDIGFTGVDIDARLRQGTTVVSTSNTSTDDEQLVWANTAVTTESLTLEVYSYSQACVDYTVGLSFE